MKKIALIILTILLIPGIAKASFSSDIKGMILLQVEENGEAWYVYPDNLNRYYLGRPADAFEIMRNLGLGIKHAELVDYLNSFFPERLSGKIMLDVEMNGEAYYVYPKELKGYYLGRPDDAFAIMREKGLGITNSDLAMITTSEQSKLPFSENFNYQPFEQPVADNSSPTTTNNQLLSPAEPNSKNTDTVDVDVNVPLIQADEISLIEINTYNYVNEHRQRIGSKKLIWHSFIADIAREHSQNMADGIIAPSHEGFDQRVAEIKTYIVQTNGAAENLAWNKGYDDPAKAAFDWWMTSSGHKASLEDNFYDLTGVGAARSADGTYYITQIFINVD